MAAGLAVAIAAVLYSIDTPLYLRLLTLAFANPFRFPFVDTAFVQSIAECWGRGVDVYVVNPCDVLGRVNDVSPLWPRMNFLPTDPAWTPWLGLGVDGAFIASLAFIPVPRRWRDLLLVGMATLSSLVVFALERGNIDLVMFVLVVVGCRRAAAPAPRVRLAGYAVVVIAGLLKFYPLAALVLISRERLGRALAIAAAVAAILVAFVWRYATELRAMVRSIPTGSYFTDLFGARQLPGGVWMVIDHGEKLLGGPGIEDARTKILIGLAFAALVVIAATKKAIHLAARMDFRAALTALPAHEEVFLMAGAALVSGCFFAAQNIGYRGVILLLVLPGFLRLSEVTTSLGLASRLRATAWAIVFVMWGLSIVHALRILITGVSDSVYVSAFYAHWLLHELAWWWIVSDCLAVLFVLVQKCPALRDLRNRVPAIATAR